MQPNLCIVIHVAGKRSQPGEEIMSVYRITKPGQGERLFSSRLRVILYLFGIEI